MRRLLLILAGAASAAVFGAVVLVCDLVFDDGRIADALLGRDGLEKACTPLLSDKLRDAGFEPREIDLGARPDIAVASGAGRTFKDTFTFQDGAAGSRVDGVVACVVDGDAVTVDFRTTAPPVRAT